MLKPCYYYTFNNSRNWNQFYMIANIKHLSISDLLKLSMEGVLEKKIPSGKILKISHWTAADKL